MHFDLLKKIASKNLIVSLSKIMFLKDKLCDACQMEKQTRMLFKLEKVILTSKHLELLHLDLFDRTFITFGVISLLLNSLLHAFYFLLLISKTFLKMSLNMKLILKVFSNYRFSEKDNSTPSCVRSHMSKIVLS